TKSICPGCARGCNIDVHVNRKRPHHAGGRRVARLKPRFNDAVNAWWICDVGRYGFGSVDDESRIRFARQRGQDLTRDDALGHVGSIIYTGTNDNGTSALATLVLPLAAWVERDGTFTNFLGRVQRFRAAVEPLGEALAGWDLFGRVLGALGGPVAGGRAELWFRELARTVPAFDGLSYQSIGDGGAMLAGAAPTTAPEPPARRANAAASAAEVSRSRRPWPTSASRSGAWRSS